MEKSNQICYDMQENIYRKIDKNTGKVEKCHCNGADISTFKLEYTGSDYLERKKNEGDLSPKYLSRKTHFSPRIASKSKKDKKTENSETLNHSISMSALSKSLNVIDRNNKTDQNYMKSGTLLSSENRFSNIWSNVDTLENKLKEYSKMKEEMKRENHSPRKYEGTQNDVEFVGNFENEIKQAYSEPKRLARVHTQINSLVFSEPKSISNLSETLRKEKVLFQKCKQFLTKVNGSPIRNIQKEEKEIKERKINMKILENLFIGQMDKETMRVYG